MGFLNRLSLGSKILLTLLLITFVSMFLTGWVSFSNGKHSLEQLTFDQLQSLRTLQAKSLTSNFEKNLDLALTMSEASDTLLALNEFKIAATKLEKVPIDQQQLRYLKDYYNKDFLPKLSKGTDSQPKAQHFIPYNSVQEYLQYFYIAKNPYKDDDKAKLTFANDGSEYSKVHQKYHDDFYKIVKRFKFDDMYLVDAKTAQVVYSEGKKVDFLTDLRSGPYSNSNLARAFEKSIHSKGDLTFVSWVDFDNYTPSYGVPKAFITTPIYEGSQIAGVLIFEVSIEKLDRLMTFNHRWQEAGLGKTGQTYLVGPDYLLRSDVRPFIENKALALKFLKEKRIDPEIIRKIELHNTPILALKLDIEPVRRALDGQFGVVQYKGYEDRSVLAAYQPVELAHGGSRWALIAIKYADEAFAPIRQLTRELIITAAILVPIVTLVSMYIARFLTNPIKNLINGTKKIMSGESGIRINVESRDETAEFAKTFNTMSANLDSKNQLLQAQIEENQRLLLNIMPEHLAERMKNGDEDLVDNYPDVTLVYIEIDGFNEIVATSTVGESRSLFNELIVAFDQAAENYGVEKFKTIGYSYIAVCGLSISRVDHILRSVQFAQAIVKLVYLFNQKQESQLSLRIGIHSGPLVGGIIGQERLVFELWGETMDIVKAINLTSAPNNIHVSESVKTDLSDTYDMKLVGNYVETNKSKIEIWALHSVDSLKTAGE